MECKYEYKGKSYSYSEIREEIQDIPEVKNASDIVYSAEKQKNSYDKIQELKSKMINENIKASSLVDGEPTFKNSIQDFIDSPAFKNSDTGQAYTSSLNYDNYKASVVDYLVHGGMDSTTAEQQANTLLEHQQAIGNDSLDLHKILNHISNKDDADNFAEKNKTDKFTSDILKSTYYSIENIFKSQIVTGAFSKCNIVKDLTLHCPLKDGGELVGHIDNLIIDAQGDIHIVNYKTTTMHPKEWQLVKEEKYKYQLVFLKKMLSHYGLDTRNTTLNIIPIGLNYNEDYSVLKSAVPYDVMHYSVRNNRYVLNKYDDVVDQFIENEVIPDVSIESLQNAESMIKTAFPTLSIKADGIRKATTEWISRYKNSPLISRINNEKGCYKVQMFQNDVPYYIKDPSRPEENKELIEYVTSKLEKQEDNITVSTGLITKAILGGYNTGFVNFDTVGLRDSKEYFAQKFSKYLEQKGDADSEHPNYIWKIIDNPGLEAARLLMFKNTETGVIDIVGLSSTPLGITRKVKGRSNLMGQFISDEKSGLITHRNDYGNIEIFRIMSVLNSIIPELDPNVKLGNVSVYSTNGIGEGRTYNIGEYVKKYWSSIMKILQTNNVNSDAYLKNNFKETQFEDPVQSLTKEYESIMSNSGQTTKQALTVFNMSELQKAQSIDAKRKILHEILEDISKMGQENYGWMGEKSIDEMMNIATSRINNTRRQVARLYLSLLDTTRRLDNLYINPDEQKLSTLRKTYLSTPEVMPSENFRVIYNLYRKTIDMIAQDYYSNEVPHLNKFINKYYDDIGYSELKNTLVGNQTAQYANMVNTSDMSLKNPYDINNNLKPAEREFLKNFIFSMGKVRYEQRKMKWTFNGINDSKFIDAVNTKDFLLYVPLKKASTASIRNSRSLWTKDFTDNAKDIFHGDFKRFTEKAMNKFSGVFDEEDIQSSKDIARKKLRAVNSFSILESPDARARALGSHYEGYYETNLESLAKDFVESDIATKRLSSMLLEVKCYLYGMKMTQYDTNNDTLKQTMQLIDDYLKVNVFDGNLMEKVSQKWAALVQPLKRFAGHSLLGFNIIGAGRDVFQGIWENTARSLNKYQIDITPSALASAYGIVVKGSLTNCRSINIINQLCLMYRLSNIDVARITEGSKTGRGGITNIENWEYASLRRPDFLNRMTIFVAKLVHDGIYDAFSIKDGKLDYNWKKDKRFYAYANNLTNDANYLKQRGLYFSTIRTWNSENPEHILDYSDDLILPYSNVQVNAIKSVSDSIYGAYDRSARSRYEYIAGGVFFGMYTTWMNGIVNNYFMKPGVYGTKNLKEEQEVDVNNNKLFFDKEGNIITQIKDKYINLDNDKEFKITELSPVYSYIPIVTQGILFTIQEAGNLLIRGRGKDFVEDIWNNDMNRKNLYKMSSDAAIFLILSGLSYLGAQALADDKKTGDKSDFAGNMIKDATLQMFTKSKDTFFGPGNVMESLDQGLTFIPLTVLNRAVKTGYKVVSGQQSFISGLTHQVAPFRTMQEAYKLYEQSEKTK